ncbi:MAG TPA: ATP-binding protein, partial [Spirochaetota bacterium]|nr:ATP-binding protein [Spirochaetota bacterium]
DQPEGQADVASTMEHTSVLLSSQLSKNRITLTQEFTHKRTLAITANRLLQLLMSLMQNAIHAILENGGEEREILVSTRETDEVVQISIRDTGCGIPQNQRSRIFEPFFTTKGPLGGAIWVPPESVFPSPTESPHPTAAFWNWSSPKRKREAPSG